MHDVQALISSHEALRRATNSLVHAVVCPFVQGFSLLPITDEQLSELNRQPKSAKDLPTSPLLKLHAGLHHLTLHVSSFAPSAYVTTAYFGGQGVQDAVVWQDSQLAFSPSTQGYHGEWLNTPISQALRVMGVAAVVGADEFDSLDLGHHRETHLWAAAHSG